MAYGALGYGAWQRAQSFKGQNLELAMMLVLCNRRCRHTQTGGVGVLLAGIVAAYSEVPRSSFATIQHRHSRRGNCSQTASTQLQHPPPTFATVAPALRQHVYVYYKLEEQGGQKRHVSRLRPNPVSALSPFSSSPREPLPPAPRRETARHLAPPSWCRL